MHALSQQAPSLSDIGSCQGLVQSNPWSLLPLQPESLIAVLSDTQLLAFKQQCHSYQPSLTICSGIRSGEAKEPVMLWCGLLLVNSATWKACNGLRRFQASQQLWLALRGRCGICWASEGASRAGQQAAQVPASYQRASEDSSCIQPKFTNLQCRTRRSKHLTMEACHQRHRVECLPVFKS